MSVSLFVGKGRGRNNECIQEPRMWLMRGTSQKKKSLPPMPWTSAEEKGVVPLKNDGISQLDLE